MEHLGPAFPWMPCFPRLRINATDYPLGWSVPSHLHGPSSCPSAWLSSWMGQSPCPSCWAPTGSNVNSMCRATTSGSKSEAAGIAVRRLILALVELGYDLQNAAGHQAIRIGVPRIGASL